MAAIKFQQTWEEGAKENQAWQTVSQGRGHVLGPPMQVWGQLGRGEGHERMSEGS